MSYARSPKGKLYFFQLHEASLEWLAYPEMRGHYSLRWSTESRTWVPKLGIEVHDWSLDVESAIYGNKLKRGKGNTKLDGKFFANITAVVT